MNDWTAIYPYPGGSYDETCNFCGAVFHVEIQLQDGHNDTEEYFCPECGKEYRVRACMTPTVTLISGRTDNRNCTYPNN